MDRKYFLLPAIPLFPFFFCLIPLFHKNGLLQILNLWMSTPTLKLFLKGGCKLSIFVCSRVDFIIMWSGVMWRLFVPICRGPRFCLLPLYSCGMKMLRHLKFCRPHWTYWLGANLPFFKSCFFLFFYLCIYLLLFWSAYLDLLTCKILSSSLVFLMRIFL